MPFEGMGGPRGGMGGGKGGFRGQWGPKPTTEPTQ